MTYYHLKLKAFRVRHKIGFWDLPRVKRAKKLSQGTRKSPIRLTWVRPFNGVCRFKLQSWIKKPQKVPKTILFCYFLSFQFMPNGFAFIFALICSIRHRKICNDIVSSFYVCDEKLKSSFGTSFALCNVKTKRLSLLACIVTFICGSIISALFYVVGVDLEKIWSLFYWIAFCLPKFGLMLLSFQFCGMIILLSDRIRLLIKGMR